MIATTVDCPLCGVTVLGQGRSVVEATSAAIDALDQHINDHHTIPVPGVLASLREPSRTFDLHETDRDTI